MKKLKYMTLALVMAMTSLTPVFAEVVDIKFTPGSLFYQVGEESKNISQEIYIKNDKIMVPVEYLGEALNLEPNNITWDRYENSLTIYSGNKIIQMKIGDNVIHTNEGKIQMDVAPEYKDLDAMFPISYLADLVGAKYEYKDGSLTFKVDKAEEVITFGYDYNKLLELAYKNSKDLKKVDLSIEKAEELEADAKNNVKSIPLSSANGEKEDRRNGYYITFKSQQVARQMAEKNVDKTKEQIQYSLKGLYYDLLKAQENKEMVELSLDVAKDVKSQTIIKYENGMASEYEKNKAIRSYDEAQKNYDMAVKSEKTAYEALNYFVGLNPDELYTIDNNVTMQQVGEDEMKIDFHILDMINQSPDIWYLEQKVDLAELQLKLFVFNAGNNYEATEIDIETTEIELKEAKEKYEETLRKLNTSIKTLEDKYENDKISYEKAKDDYELAKLNETLGLAIPLDVKMAELQLESAKNALNETVRTYNKTVDVYLKPWM